MNLNFFFYRTKDEFNCLVDSSQKHGVWAHADSVCCRAASSKASWANGSYSYA